MTTTERNTQMSNTRSSRLVSLTETAWRTGLASDPDTLSQYLERENDDALVMTSRGVRVDIERLVSEEPAAFTLPVVEFIGDRVLG